MDIGDRIVFELRRAISEVAEVDYMPLSGCRADGW
jgi:hypothetical protein